MNIFDLLLPVLAIANYCCFGGANSLIASAIAEPGDPLVFDRQDPLIPVGYEKRKLTSFEKYRIERAIARLNQDGEEELDRGNTEAAFSLWYRSLRLSRALDRITEIKTLGKIGAIAWKENSTEDVRNIANRLIAIEAEQNSDRQLVEESLTALARAFESVRYLDKAIEVYQQILQNSDVDRAAITERLGELYLAIFDYSNAAKIYEDKLNKESSKQQAKTLQTLIDIYDRSGQNQKSIAVKQRLSEYYRSINKPARIAALEKAIARNYQASGQIERAIATYRQAFDTASNNQQLALAISSLVEVGKLHQKQNNLERAINTYKQLLTVQQNAYDYYGLVNTHDALGNIYLKLDQIEFARQSFVAGLAIAETINYRTDYLRDRLQQFQAID
ncbi:MAG: hypothetical protein AAGE96_07900 [Cyanobacteria bacterium P01_G01_bin.19]